MAELPAVAQPPHKRRRIAHEEIQEGNALEADFGGPADTALGMDIDMDFNMGNNEPVGFGEHPSRSLESVLTVLNVSGGDYESRMRSSEVGRALPCPVNELTPP